MPDALAHAYAHASLANPSQAGREPAIPLQYSRALQQAELLRKQLEELQMRLTPLVGPDMPILSAPPGEKSPPSCELADKLVQLVNMIDGGNAILANLLRRLEI